MKRTVYLVGILSLATAACQTSEASSPAEPAARSAPQEAAEGVVAQTPASNTPSEPAEGSGEEVFEGARYHHTEIAGVLASRSPALQSAVVAALSRHNVPGHDTEAVYYLERDGGLAVVLTLVFPRGFVHPVHGPQARVQTMTCAADGDTWACDMILPPG